VDLGREGIDTSLRRLYRVAVSGPGGRGSLRVALVVLGPSAYSLSVSDTFGRSLWDLRVDPERSYLIDHRHDAYCEIDASMPLPGDTLGLFPLEILPALLLGRLPVTPSRKIEYDGGVEFRDDSGRRWTAEWKDSMLNSWTLWQEEEPRVWWMRQPKGGILSSRLGSQIRWRQTLEERLQDDFQVPELPVDYEEGVCNESDLPELSEVPTRP